MKQHYNHREVDYSRAGLRQGFIVFGQPTVASHAQRT